MEANILLVKCAKSRKTVGVRIQKMEDGDWWRTWAFKVNDKQAHNEGYDKTGVKGNLNSTNEYEGCPYCGTDGFVQCSKCKKITCWNDESSVTCGWCGTLLKNIVIAKDKFNVSTDRF